MFQKWLAVCLVAAISVASFGAVVAQQNRGRGGDGGSRVRPNKVEGTVTAVNTATGQVAIRGRGGVTVVVVATAATKIERNDRHVALSAIKVGDRGQALFDANFIASKIESVGP